MAKRPQNTPLEINVGDFEQTGPEERLESRLLATVSVFGIPHHLELIEVESDSDGVQTAVYERYAGWGSNALDHLSAYDGGDGPYQEIELGDRRYIAVMTPFRR